MSYRFTCLFFMVALAAPSLAQGVHTADSIRVREKSGKNPLGLTSHGATPDSLRTPTVKIIVSREGNAEATGDTLQLSQLTSELQKIKGGNKVLARRDSALVVSATPSTSAGILSPTAGEGLRQQTTQPGMEPGASQNRLANQILQEPSVNLPRVTGSDSTKDHGENLASKTAAQQISDLMLEMQKIREDNKVLAGQIGTLKVPGTSPIKVGVLAQMYGQALQDQTTAVQDTSRSYTKHVQRQLFIRRLRALFGGEISKSTSFFVESDATNIGKVDVTGAKLTKVSMYIQDAYIQQTFMPELSLIAGLQLVGITRNSLQSAASLMAADYGSYQFLTSTPFDNTAGRDVGVNLRGFLFDQRLEYRAGLFSGKNLNLYSPLRTVVRLNYMFEDREKGFFYTGTTLGKGKMLTIGGGLDLQGSYQSYSLDAFADVPLFQAGSITASGSWTYLNGGGSDADSTFFTGAIPRQSIFFSEVGYFFKEYGVQPYLKFESEVVNAQVLRQVCAMPSTLDLQNKLRSKQRVGVGINYYMNGHNASVKLLYEFVSRWRTSLAAGRVESITTGEATAQFQLFVF